MPDAPLAAAEGALVPSSPHEPARTSRRHAAPLIAVLVALVVGLLVVVAAIAKGGTKETADTPLLDQPAPVVQTTTLDGQPFDLGARRGSWVVLNFFSTWCRPCVQEHPDLLRFARAESARADGAELVSVIFNDDESDVRQFFADNGGDWPKLTDRDGRIQVAFGVAKSPETWIIDPDGIVRARIIARVSADGLGAIMDRLRGPAPG
jgi:cytochrome c biogenesis protein CcmG, thiol:disulfide interchange protein DsbE